MANRAALVIAVETFFEVGPPIPYAAADAAELVRALPAAGYSPKKCFMLAGHRTTKAVIDSHLARLPKLIGKVDSLLVLFIGRAFSLKQRGYFACTDTIATDFAGTSIAFSDLVGALHKTKVAETTVLLDVDPLDVPGEIASSGLDAGELRERFEESPTCVALLSTSPGDRSYESALLRHGIWRYHLIEAFTGKQRTAVNSDGSLSATSLQSYLEDAVPRTLHRMYDSHYEQTPILLGSLKNGFVLGNVKSLLIPTSDLLDPSRMKRVVFRSETAGRVKDLAGFRKSHTLPERANEWARKYIIRIAQPDLKSDLDSTLDAIRDAFGYKRKDLEVSTERDGIGFIRTPHFEYTVSVTLSGEDPNDVVWRREVGRLKDPALVYTTAFIAVFGTAFDRLVFEFAVPVNVAELVDRIEDSALEGVSVRVVSDADAAEVQLAGIPGRVRLSASTVEIVGRSGFPAGLLDMFLQFLRKFSSLGEMKSLMN